MGSPELLELDELLELLEVELEELELLELLELVVELELLVLEDGELLELDSLELELLALEELDWSVSFGSTAGLTQPAKTSTARTSQILFTTNCGSQGY